MNKGQTLTSESHPIDKDIPLPAPTARRKRGVRGRKARPRRPKVQGIATVPAVPEVVAPLHPHPPARVQTPPLQKPPSLFSNPSLLALEEEGEETSSDTTQAPPVRNGPPVSWEGSPRHFDVKVVSSPQKGGATPVIESGEDITSLPVFAEKVLGLPLYGWQRKLLESVDRPNSRTAAKCANGSGKTSHISAPAALWHPCVYPASVTITTSGVFRQVKEQMWPQIRRMAGRMKGFDIAVNQTDIVVSHDGDIDKASKVVGFSTDDPGKFEGWHGESLLGIFDESKTIPDEIFEAWERCAQGQPSRVLLLSSPGRSSGQFYRTFNEERESWSSHTITAAQCPHIDSTQTAALIEKWGISHPLVRSMVFAEFMVSEGEELILPPQKLKYCRSSKPNKRRGARTAFADFAAGGDENVLAIMDGNEVLPLHSWTDKNTMSSVGRFLQLFRKHDLLPENVFADSSGLGHPMCDALAEAGFSVNRVNNGTAAHLAERYQNRGSEIWFSGARAIERAEVILPEDQIMDEQLCCRRFYMSPKGKLCAETKDEMRSRGVRSPDRADAVLGVIACSEIRWDILSHSSGRDPFEVLKEQHDDSSSDGFYVGG